jgi:hypothetical protein
MPRAKQPNTRVRLTLDAHEASDDLRYRLSMTRGAVVSAVSVWLSWQRIEGLGAIVAAGHGADFAVDGGRRGRVAWEPERVVAADEGTTEGRRSGWAER